MGKPADMAMVANPCTSGVICTTSTIMDQTMELNQVAQASFDVLAAPSYSGTVTVSVDSTSFNTLSGGAAPDVNIGIVPASFQLAAGGKNTVSVNLTTTTAAAAFTSKKVVLHVADSADPTKSFDVPFNLTVNPQLTITFTGAGTGNDLHTWSTDVGTTINFKVRSRPVSGTTGGTNFVFLNKDASGGSHIVHGDGKITHQSTNGTGTPPNGTYMVPNVNDTVNLTNADGFYCHTHNTSGSTPTGTRFITFIP
jgi:hypothetical protein